MHAYEPSGAILEGMNSSTGKDGGSSEELSEAQRRFREALERKNALSGEHPGNAGAQGQKLKGSNSKRQRQFRRKSG
jgi:hypothetical protein